MSTQPEKLNEAMEKDQNEAGATMLEYGLLAALIAVVCILAVTFLGQRACSTFSRVGSSLNGAIG